MLTYIFFFAAGLTRLSLFLFGKPTFVKDPRSSQLTQLHADSYGEEENLRFETACHACSTFITHSSCSVDIVDEPESEPQKGEHISI
jgi:hypothetical protein